MTMEREKRLFNVGLYVNDCSVLHIGFKVWSWVSAGLSARCPGRLGAVESSGVYRATFGPDWSWIPERS